MLAHPWGTLFGRGRQDHGDSFRSVDRYHPCWQTAIFSSLRLKIDVCSIDCLRKPPPLYPSFYAVLSILGNSCQMLNERDWEKARRPYYNMWPSIIPMLT